MDAVIRRHRPLVPTVGDNLNQADPSQSPEISYDASQATSRQARQVRLRARPFLAEQPQQGEAALRECLRGIIQVGEPNFALPANAAAALQGGDVLFEFAACLFHRPPSDDDGTAHGFSSRFKRSTSRAKSASN
jgi:hypothetical protein